MRKRIKLANKTSAMVCHAVCLLSYLMLTIKIVLNNKRTQNILRDLQAPLRVLLERMRSYLVCTQLNNEWWALVTVDIVLTLKYL